MVQGRVYGMSYDGSVLVGGQIGSLSGKRGRRAYRWTLSGGTESLGHLPGVSGQRYNARALGVSGDGNVVVGQASNSGFAMRAFRWTKATGMQDLGVLSGGNYSSATAASADGSVIVGIAAYGAQRGQREAFRWTKSTGMQGIGFLDVSHGESIAKGVSSDGSVIVGTSIYNSNGGVEAFRWTPKRGIQGLGFLGGSQSAANAVSSDGRVVVGASTNANGQKEAFRWTGSNAMQPLGSIKGYPLSDAFGVSRNGDVVVGESMGGSHHYGIAFRWTKSTGMQSIRKWAGSTAISVPSDWKLVRAVGVSSDGTVMSGDGVSPSGAIMPWIIRVNAIGTGMLVPSNYDPTLRERTVSPMSNIADLTMFGSHHRPLAEHAAASGGRGFVWADTDSSYYRSSGTHVSLVEAGEAHALDGGNVYAGLGVGISRASQSLEYGGKGTYEGSYVYGEADYLPGGGPWITSVSGMYGEWAADIARGYLNAGTVDHSSGSTNARTWSVRLREGWEDAVSLGGAGLSPFVSVSRSVVTMDGYRERGGAFPAVFDARRMYEDLGRIGVDMAARVRRSTVVHVRLAAVGRIGACGASSARGGVIGLYTFGGHPSCGGHRMWGRVLAEVDQHLSSGLSLVANMNTSTPGLSPTWGVSLGVEESF